MYLLIDVIDNPLPFSPEIVVKKPERKIKAKFKFRQRSSMLAQPKRPVKKFVTEPSILEPKVFEPLCEETEFFSDHLSRAPLRTLYDNKILLDGIGDFNWKPRHIKSIHNHVHSTWNGIYYYYKKRLREKHLKKIRRMKRRKLQKKLKGLQLKPEELEKLREEHRQRLATPKPLHEEPPRPKVKPSLPIDELVMRLALLAQPKEYHIEKPRNISQVNPAALKYELTENMKQLFEKWPERYRRRSSGFNPWKIKPSALKKRQISERLENLARPHIKVDISRVEEETDPWASKPISRKKKYKCSARTEELARPRMRE